MYFMHNWFKTTNLYLHTCSLKASIAIFIGIQTAGIEKFSLVFGQFEFSLEKIISKLLRFLHHAFSEKPLKSEKGEET